MPVTTRQRNAPLLSTTTLAATKGSAKGEAKRIKTEPVRSPAKRKKKGVELEPVQSSAAPVVTPPPKKKRKTATNSSSPTVARKAPVGWEDIYSIVEELRQDRTAPCDHSGAEALPQEGSAGKDFRFQVLLSLMLSSQTKDHVVGEAIRSMQAAGVLSVDAIAAMDPVTLDGYIAKVGFHNNKTKYIKQAVEILSRDHGGDVPPTAALMMELPGVGPKMAYICESICWNTQSGIGVDTHMHRLFNLLRWVDNTKNPEQTRIQLQAWLPHEKWANVNLLWVGFGQEVQQFKPKILNKALSCSRPAQALKLLKRCGLDYVKEGKKLGLEEQIQKALKNE